MQKSHLAIGVMAALVMTAMSSTGAYAQAVHATPAVVLAPAHAAAALDGLFGAPARACEGHARAEYGATLQERANPRCACGRRRHESRDEGLRRKPAQSARAPAIGPENHERDQERQRWRGPERPRQVDVWNHGSGPFHRLISASSARAITATASGQRYRSVYRT